MKIGKKMLSAANKMLVTFSWLGKTDLNKEWNSLIQYIMIQDKGLRKNSSLT